MYRGSVADALARDRVRERRGSAAPADLGISDALANAATCSLCSRRELKLIARSAQIKRVARGTTVAVEGEWGDCMYVLLSGGANVHKGGRKIAQLRAGDMCGELAVLTKMPRNATVTMNADGEVARISRRAVHRLLEDAPGFSRKMLEGLALRISNLDKKLVL